ncbi:MAG TPA: hypothetical protein RMH26_01210, partial [Polyangiaceae bacterium LLY-WYZ-15_(1-7)]|nr:hypothetical protein [Polyangiaceae bacterium LLY-WYZ-15_(1-7)]
MRRPAFVPSFLLALACGPAEPAPEPSEPAPAASSASEARAEPPSRVGPRPGPWVDARVAEARARLAGSEAGRLVWESIEHHGGLRAWLAAGTIAFEFDYRPVDAPERRMHTFQKIDLWSARAVHEELEGGAGASARFAWDGERAWIAPGPDAFPTPARFWALTPYYFVGMPFVVADSGARYERLPDAELDGVLHRLVKITYEAGTGDSPDDYYVLYLHPRTHALAALRYVVAYPGFFPDGGHTPEKLMRYDAFEAFEGPAGAVRLATRYDTSRWDAEAGRPGEVVTRITASRVGLGETYPEDVFAPPPGADVSAEITAPEREPREAPE